MLLGAYHFDGDPDALLASYRRLQEAIPTNQLSLHVCVAGPDGITVLDACPSEESFRSFSAGAAFVGARRAAGLPEPRIEHLGEVTSLVVDGTSPQLGSAMPR